MQILLMNKSNMLYTLTLFRDLAVQIC